MQLRDWFRPPRHVLAIFLGVALVSATALGWLGWLLLQQDNAVEAQRRRERLDDAADRAVAVMQRAVAVLESQLGPRLAGTAPLPGLTLVSAGPNDIVGQGLPFYPMAAVLPEAPPETFAEAERLEFAAHDPVASGRAYEMLAESANPGVRAGALTRLARIARKLHDSARAERAYGRLAQVPRAGVAGLPAGLIAREGRASLFAETNRPAELAHEAAAFLADLYDGRWQLNKQQFEFYRSEAAAWLGTPPTEPADALARAEAFDWLWRNRQSAEPISHRVIQAGDGPVLVVWTQTADRVYAALAGRRWLEALCRDAVPGGSFQWTLTDQEGRAVLGQAPPARDVAVRTAATTRLPWTFHLFARNTPSGIPSRRRLLLWVFAVLAVVLSTGAYFILRAISRELRVSRLQSDFVSAVSHEFRSPLTSMAQISEMLVRDRIPSEDLRRKSYDVLSRETERLRRLVEGLLDFGRFEAGAAAYRFETIEAGAFVRGIVADFQERVAGLGYAVELRAPDDELWVQADREALLRAIWNLLDNAVKYSPDCRTVWVDVEREAGRVSIAVRDRGLGIPAKEQRQIFEKFVRGAESKALRIKGTGIGLAMVRHIVQAHGGEILLSSEPGQGSRFTMVLRAAGGAS